MPLTDAEKWERLRAEAKHWWDVANKQSIAYRSIDAVDAALRAEGERSAWNIALHTMNRLDATEDSKS